MGDIHQVLLVTLVNTAILSAVLVGSTMSVRSCRQSRTIFVAVTLLLLLDGLINLEIAGHSAVEFPVFVRTSYVIRMLTPGLLYFYFRALLDPEFHFWRQNPGHLFPALIGVVWFAAPWLLNRPDLLFNTPAFFFERYLYVIVQFIVSALYAVGVVNLIRNYEARAKMNFSNTVEFRMTWMRAIAWAIAVELAFKVFDILTGPNFAIWMFNSVILSGALAVLTFLALRTSRLPHLEVAAADSTLDPAEIERLGVKLYEVLADPSVLGNARVHLDDIAAKMGIKSYRLSEVLGQGLHTNFNDLMNGLRVQRAKTLLLSPTHDHMSILAIAFDSGFSSKSAFNEVFKKQAGLTPSHFRLNGVAKRATAPFRTSPLANPDA